ncbi:hypothetical protein A2767_03940 [Candidatus Roizmanbacteria bacterium RIFCSPHIGHO2_01_FULL_35_10]|uniref:Uncharacterized protein n=1 Tax=Candidatus Roizmanbacteria bacterium RIFCSPLOWO2_01_FULL_35_13 TaxID=1802055 RepID=A0A1F7I9Y6_9BACT|nr:MAG: hypothetical protein A2767_03940 [Candidatus Roizmanbacteria bacterium RIFCSPHIGHO2_01_FULL_35_10]OGK40174.1 MAG: hypothetical protein A3A74_06690 [Candidatus Roizmanbacteria bacterium RIFCSPLOWO2_01_FULL_35_13]
MFRLKKINPVDIEFLGFIFASGLYTPANLLGLIKHLKSEGAIVNQDGQKLLDRAKSGFLSNIRSSFVGKQPLFRALKQLKGNN